MGGTVKGGHGHIHAAYSRSRRWNVYVLMVIISLVFGCATLGVMGLHRLKDRRIHNLLIKEKDDQILSLHLLLQKERGHMQEVKRKTEEMKMKIYNLQAQRTELNGRILDLQSTISSLKNEQRTMELAFQEKQNEAKLLREKYIEVKDQNPRVTALTEILRQKESEIEDLKHRLPEIEDLKHHLELRAKVGSLSTDELSIIPANIKAKENIPGSETTSNQSQDKSGDMHDGERKNPADDMESTRNDASINRETESSMQGKEQRENGRLIKGRSETTRREEFDRLENSQERSAENGRTNVDRRSDQVEQEDNYDPENRGSSETGQEKKREHGTEMIGNLGNEEQKPRDKDSEAHFTDSNELATMGYAHSRRTSNSKESDNQELGVHTGGAKLEMQQNSKGGHFRFEGKHSYLKWAKGKRWRPIAKQTERKRNSGSNGASTMGGQGLVEGTEELGTKLEEGKPTNQDKIQDSVAGLRIQNESILKDQQFGIDDKLPDAGQATAKANLKGYNEENNGENTEDSPPGFKLQNSIKPVDTEDMSAKFDMSNQVENGWEANLTNSSSVKSQISLDEVPKNSIIKSEDSGSSNKGAVQDTEEDERSKEQNIVITEHTENKNDGKHNNGPGRTEVAERNEDPDGIHTEDFEESELGNRTSMGSAENSGEDSEEDKDQTDEPEF
ncbi:hypothetical protein Pfo_013892 [Paulownia fortunei]|nr:hypothetical protein Pfo_013892 [Paulownia fortunei]